MQSGFFGKLPARGDFIRSGLPSSFVNPWDDWMQAVLPSSKAELGEAWLPAWMEAPVWRFRIPAGVCGAAAVTGVFMPSVDKAGRHFPLTLACVGANMPGDAWLDGAEAAGISALEHILEPDALMRQLRDVISGPGQAGDGDCHWWTDGAPLVPATSFISASLPAAAQFVRMLVADGRDDLSGLYKNDFG